MAYLPQETISLVDYSNNTVSTDFFGNIVSPIFNTDICIKVQNNSLSQIYDFLPITVDVNRTLSYSDNVATFTASAGISYSAQSKQTALFTPASQNKAFFCVSFTTPQAGVTKIAELFNSETEIGIGYVGTSFSIIYKRSFSSPPQNIPQVDWKGNLLKSGQTFDPSLLNNFLIEYTNNYSIKFSYYAPGYGWVLLHELKSENSFLILANANFRFQLLIQGSTNNSSIKFCYVHVGYCGDYLHRKRKYISWTSAQRNITTTTYSPFASIFINPLFNSVQNFGRAKIENISFLNSSGTTTALRAFYNPVLTGFVYSAPYTGNTDYFTLFDNSSTSTTQNVPSIFSCLIASGTGTGAVPVTNREFFYDLYFYQNDTVAFCVNSNVTIGISIDIVEEL